MMMSSKGREFQAKQEGDSNTRKIYKTPSGQRQWAGFKNPRIVRVSRSFGGKDRHSKVYTIRGLRDRRIRLSVPTAIHLYDLQDRLGLSQPSKVVDWLLDATKHEIDKLPPLHIPPENFSQFHPSILVNSQELNATQFSISPFFNANPTNMKNRGTQPLLYSKEGIKIHDHAKVDDQTIVGKTKNWVPGAALKEKCKEPNQTDTSVQKISKWITRNEQESPGGIGNYIAQVSAQNFFPVTDDSSYPGLLNNNLPYNPSYYWDIPNLSLSQYGSHGLSSQREDSNSSHSVLPESSLALPSSSQLYFCPSATAASLVPSIPPLMTTSMESDPGQLNYLQLLSSSSHRILPNSFMPSLNLLRSPVKSSTVNANPKILHSHNNEETQLNKVNSCS